MIARFPCYAKRRPGAFTCISLGCHCHIPVDSPQSQYLNSNQPIFALATKGPWRFRHLAPMTGSPVILFSRNRGTNDQPAAKPKREEMVGNGRGTKFSGPEAKRLKMAQYVAQSKNSPAALPCFPSENISDGGAPARSM